MTPRSLWPAQACNQGDNCCFMSFYSGNTTRPERDEMGGSERASQLFSSLLQAFFLTQGFFLLAFGHQINVDSAKLITEQHYSFVIPSTIVITSVIFYMRGKEHRASEHLTTLRAWLFYAVVLAAVTPQASVVLGLFLVSTAIACYKNTKELPLFIALLFFICRLTALLLKSGGELPAYLKGLPASPPLSGEITSELAVIIPLALIAYGWYWINQPRGGMVSLVRRLPLSFYRALLIACLSIHLLWSGWFLLARLRTFMAPTYDMGIFTQMFHSMNRTALPLTTLERDIPLSHFKVHISPIVYLLLPVFKLFPHPATIQLSQVVLTASGAFPVYLLAGHYGLGKRTRFLWTCAYLLLPAMILSSFYDFHENVFLAPVLLFLVYFIARGKLTATVLFSLLTLMVKEDAFLYLSAVSLLLLFGFRDRKITSFTPRTAVCLGIGMLLAGVSWFGLAVSYLSIHGTGAMTGRFNNLSGIPAWGILSVIPTVFLNFTLFMETVFVRAKIGYLLTSVIALGFLPLLNRKFHRLFLWIPFVVMNLMSNYVYQYRIDFQYNYGSGALLFLLALLTYSEYASRTAGCRRNDLTSAGKQRSPLERLAAMKERLAARPSLTARQTLVHFLLLLAIAASLVQTCHMLAIRSLNARRIQQTARYTYSDTIRLLDQIPRDSVVAADGMVTVHLADIEELYDFSYYKWRKDRPYPDFIVLRRAATVNYTNYPMILSLGYREVPGLSSDWLLVMRRDIQPDP